MSKDFLSAIIARKRQTVAELYANCEVTALRAQALKCREAAAPHRLRDALQTASPSHQDHRGIQAHLAITRPDPRRAFAG